MGSGNHLFYLRRHPQVFSSSCFQCEGGVATPPKPSMLPPETLTWRIAWRARPGWAASGAGPEAAHPPPRCRCPGPRPRPQEQWSPNRQQHSQRRRFPFPLKCDIWSKLFGAAPQLVIGRPWWSARLGQNHKMWIGEPEPRYRLCI